MRLPVHEEPLAAVWLTDLRSVGAVVVDDLGEQVGGAVEPLRLRAHSSGSSSQRIALAGADAEHHAARGRRNPGSAPQSEPACVRAA